MLAALYLICGLALVVAGVIGLAGLWWGLLVAGAAALIVGVLEARGADPVDDDGKAAAA